MVNYRNGKIYRIVNDVNDTVYIGSTTQKLCQRMQSHKQDATRRDSPLYSAMNELGWVHFRILLVKLYECENKQQLEAEEYGVIHQLKQSGATLFNCFIDGKHTLESRRKMSRNRKSGGCVFYDPKGKRWGFKWNESIGFSRCVVFPVKKYTAWGAERLARLWQRMTYPDMKFD